MKVPKGSIIDIVVAGIVAAGAEALGKLIKKLGGKLKGPSNPSK